MGGYSPPFRPLTDDEDDAIAEQVNQAKPDVLWVGIGVPKQEKWMVRMRDRLEITVDVRGGRGVRLPPGGLRPALDPGTRPGCGRTRITREARPAAYRHLYADRRFMLGFARQYLAERSAGSASPD